MLKPFKLGIINVSNPKVWIVIVVGVAGIVILAETRRRRLRARNLNREDFGAFIERFELLPFPQPPPPAARLTFTGLTFAIKDNFDVKDYITGFGNPDWKRTHEAACKTAVPVTALLKNGATCVGKTVIQFLSISRLLGRMYIMDLQPTHKYFSIFLGDRLVVQLWRLHPNLWTFPPIIMDLEHWLRFFNSSKCVKYMYLTSQLLNMGTDTIGCVRLPASFCGVLGYRPSQGIVSTIGVLPNSRSLDTIGWFARDPSILQCVGHVLLQLNQVEPRRIRRFIIANDLFQLSKVPKQKTVHIIRKVTEKLSGYQSPKHINSGQHITSNVPSLKGFCEQSNNLPNGISALRALSSVMFLLQRYEFKTNHEEWVKSTKPKLGHDVSVLAATTTMYENIKTLYKVRTEMHVALQSLLKDDGILVIPTVADPPLELNSKEGTFN